MKRKKVLWEDEIRQKNAWILLSEQGEKTSGAQVFYTLNNVKYSKTGISNYYKYKYSFYGAGYECLLSLAMVYLC